MPQVGVSVSLLPPPGFSYLVALHHEQHSCVLFAGSSTCPDCPVGTSNPIDGGLNCEPCAVGTYNHLTKQSACFACSPGRAAPNVGQSVCTTCVRGTHAPNYGATVCAVCVGTFVCTRRLPLLRRAPSLVPIGHAFCFRSIILCSSAQLVTTLPATNRLRVLGSFDNLPLGSNEWNRMRQNTCLRLILNFRVLVDHRRCPSGTYSGVPGSSDCSLCARGTFASSDASTACAECEAG